MVGILTVDAGTFAARAATVLCHEVRSEVDMRQLARLVEIERRALEGAVRVRGAVVELDRVACGEIVSGTESQPAFLLPCPPSCS